MRLEGYETPTRANINMNPSFHNRRTPKISQGYQPGIINNSFDADNSQSIYTSNENEISRAIKGPFDSEATLERHYGGKQPSNDLVNNILTKKLMSIINQQNNEIIKNQERNQLEVEVHKLIRQIQEQKNLEQQILEKRVKERNSEQLNAVNTEILLDKLIQAFNKGYEMRQKEV